MNHLCQEHRGYCSQCGFPIGPNMRRKCKQATNDWPDAGTVEPGLAVKIEAHGLGTLIESALESVGITKERWGDFKHRLGLPPGCNCQRKIDYLDKLSAELGEKARTTVCRLMGIGKNRASHNSSEETLP